MNTSAGIRTGSPSLARASSPLLSHPRTWRSLAPDLYDAGFFIMGFLLANGSPTSSSAGQAGCSGAPSAGDRPRESTWLGNCKLRPRHGHRVRAGLPEPVRPVFPPSHPVSLLGGVQYILPRPWMAKVMAKRNTRVSKPSPGRKIMTARWTTANDPPPRSPRDSSRARSSLKPPLAIILTALNKRTTVRRSVSSLVR